ncbi:MULTISPECIES: ABC transporter substrate-binding protein [unclassified Neptuniibacter]|uniref:ABC transporter substrate-binding protein n=1 Tax=unclassified Neptuniibacter TaxID=2630693 RepID=UPI0025E254B4|nr:MULTISPECIES: ABC transporter substrate-binding protein [unclassified Neptuniibacter]|tara:strand:- start:3038 stop:4201 length:1164 start_codon:yes stop_codon:yes gene_type:complete
MRLNKKKNTLAISLALLLSSEAYANLEVNISYLKQEIDKGPVLSNILPEPENAGIQGAKLAIQDSNTTGRFLKHKYDLKDYSHSDATQLLMQAQQQYSEGTRFFVLNTDAKTLKEITKALPADALFFNAGTQDDDLRQSFCSPNLLHTSASRAMLNDALAQLLKAKRLQKIFVITGEQPEDIAYSNAFKRSAKRFGLSIVKEKNWSFDTDLRRTAQREMPLFTQHKGYDAVFVADERGDFGEYVLYNTWLPRPVIGTQGLSPVAWHRVVEQYGAAQLQSRFDKLSSRWMNDKDYAAWAAVRSVAEAVTRTNKSDAINIRDYIRSDQFELAAFKGRKLNYREWNGQLRQPIPVIHPRSLVSQSPQEGFLHPKNELDTLGFDRAEVDCK